MNPVDYFRSAFSGTATARREHARALSAGEPLLEGLAELARLCPVGSGTESPIFLLSAGWRSGSTLVQRLIMSDPRVLLWGEPFDECGVIQAMAGTVRAFRKGWPPPDYYLSAHGPVQPGALSEDWIANLFPAPEAFVRAHRAFFESGFARPAADAGFARWGIKEVRLGAGHARYLRWLYPNARFVFLYRNPLHAYRSYCAYGRNWYDTWPDKPVFTPWAFGRHWRALAEGLLRDAQVLDALVVRYEDLASGDTAMLRRMEQHLDIRIDASVLHTRVGGSDGRSDPTPVSGLERALLRRAVAPLAQTLGYRW